MGDQLFVFTIEIFFSEGGAGIAASFGVSWTDRSFIIIKYSM